MQFEFALCPATALLVESGQADVDKSGTLAFRKNTKL